MQIRTRVPSLAYLIRNVALRRSASAVVALVMSVVASATFAALAQAPASADPAALIDKAKELVVAGMTLEAIDALDEAAYLVSTKGAPSIRRIVATEGKATGFGMYEPRKTKDFMNGTTVDYYAEPVGLKWTRDGDLHIAAFAVSIEWVDERGNLVVNLPDAVDFSFRAFARARDVHTTISLDLDPTRPLPPGNYTVRISITDKQTGQKSAPVTDRITITK